MRLKLVGVAVAALAPVVAMSGYNEYAMRQERAEEVRAQAAQAAKQASSEVERIIEGLRSLLTAVTAMPAVRQLDVPLCNDALKTLGGSVPNIRTLFVLKPDGSPVCGSAEFPAGVTFGDRDYFKDALATKDFVVGRYTKSRFSGSPVLPLAMPIIDGGKTIAVVVSGVRLDWLQTRIAERGVAPGNAVTIADGDGTILARVPLPEKFVGTVIPDAYQSLVHANAPGVVQLTSQDGTERILGYRPIALPGSPLYVSAGFSTNEAFAPINRASIANLVGIGAGAIVSLILAMFIGGHFLLGPISRIAEVMQNWRDGKTKARTLMKPTDELHAVGASLDNLLDELETRRLHAEKAEEERSLLVRELAHRVKNGFALVQAIAHQSFKKSDAEKYGSFSQRLTALAGTYDLILSGEGRATSIMGVLETSLRAHATDERRIALEGPDVVLPTDLALPLSLVTHELATNATKYGALSSDEGKVEVEWMVDAGRVAIRWAETNGPQVAVPARKGFGTVLIERAFPSKARAVHAFHFEPSGLVFELTFLLEEPIDRVEVCA
ncbi:histidine kinase [Rhizobium altiplani]|uniref:histidine kinase n=1 Tax=Rhizobium altiplani TaxID=1864509 RepID=A0A109JZ38_9HYPH|nr:sensor histidine kinase [Rhizobium altiplani]KWV57706.1 histidine kinase [Rhizobium altiplani]